MTGVLHLTLYGTYGCHLCDQAAAICQDSLRGWPAVELGTIDIATDEALMVRYGVRIPVLREPISARELGWPFDSADLHAFLSTLTEQARR